MKMIARITLMLTVVAVCLRPALPAGAQALSFESAASYAAGTSPTAVAAGDLNGDGKPDLAVTNQNGVSILLNDGSGHFSAGAAYTVGTNPQSVVIDDFDGNGRRDLAVVNQGSTTVSILLGNGDGTFNTGAVYATGANPRMVLSADFNGDGKRDLLVVNSVTAPGTSGVSVYVGNGDGTFQSPTFIALGNASISATIQDFNADGKPDIAVANSGSDTISILLGNGNGTFQPAVNISLDQPGIVVSPSSIVAGDFNLDGKPDLAVATPNVHDIAVLLGNGNGTFGAAVHFPLDDPNFSNNVSKLAVADLSGDGSPDLILCNLSSNHVTVLLGKGDGTFPSAVSYAAGPEPIGIALLDADGDGYIDVVAADNAVDGEVSVLLGRGDGTLHAAPLRRSGFVPTALAAADFNNDGKLDLVTASSTSNALPPGFGTGVVILGNADGTFQTPKIWSTSTVSSVAVADLDGDKNMDLVATNPSPGNGSVSVLFGKGDGTFQAPVNYTAGTTPQMVVVGDLNGDGRPDLVVANHGSGNFSVLLNAGSGVFANAVSYATPNTGTPDAISIGDFNGDGKPDVAVAITGVNATSVAVYLGNGDGTFQPYTNVASGFKSPLTLRVAAGDFNGDGITDIALTDGAQLSILLMSGTTISPLTQVYLVAAGAGVNGTLVAADLNGDGKPDLAVTSRDGLAVFQNAGNGSFMTPIQYSPFLGGAVLAADIYGTGLPALIAADSGQDQTPTDTVAVLANTTIRQVTVPNVVGDTQSAASSAIAAGGLVVGQITTANNSTVPAGDVISQSPAAGTLVNAGSAVDLVISSGPLLGPPAIAPAITGTVGTNGWYLSGVTVIWNVIDIGSAITSSTGCGSTTLLFSTPGTTLTCSATNAAGLSNSVSTTVKIDVTPPVLTVPATITVNAASSAGASVAYTVTASDWFDPSPVVACVPPSGSVFPIGTTTVTCTATALSGNQSTATFSVVVRGLQTGGTADLAIANMAPATVPSRDTMTYTIQVANLGNNTANQVVVADLLPTGVVPLSAVWAPTPCTIVQGLPSCAIPTGGAPCARVRNVLVCSIGTLAPVTLNQAGAGVKIVVQVSALPGSALTDSAIVRASNPDPNGRNNISTVTTRVTR